MILILTLKLDLELQDFFEQQRSCYYPKNLNQIPAHCCLFHQLPEPYFAQIDSKLQIIATNTSFLPVITSGIKFLGKGNAYALLLDKTIFLDLQKCWWDWLIPQDQQPWQPHVTIQNKVKPNDAKELNLILQSQFFASTGKIVGFDLWRYLGGPWQFLKSYNFQDI